ncbi:ESCO1/2 acetyl-transferase-domain-containing protein [Lipomyces kononenkoae]|uniref:ESCO1/2 acetyl-transferase-domain-containing protein n=1 Tax=Lipomyces kononenkoae TaxID=34357 RepID=A0ACC3T338_LIPKO
MSNQATPPHPRRPTATYRSRRRVLGSVSNSCSSSDTIVVPSSTPSTPPSSPPPTCKRSRTQTPVPAVTKTATSKVQTYLSLSNKPHRTTCPQCGMSYDTISPDDTRLHSRFHARAIGGVDVTIPRHCTRVATVYLREPVPADTRTATTTTTTRKASIYKFTVRDLSRSTPALRSVKTGVDATLRLCNSELSAPDEPLSSLAHRTDATVFMCVASRCTNENKIPDNNKDAGGGGGGGGAHVIVGICLVERAENGYFMSVDTGRLLRQSQAPQVIMGISRLYTVHSARRIGVARAMLDAARRNFVYGLEVDKGAVGWSQPSESGCRVATRWCSLPMTEDEVREDRRDKAGEGLEGQMNIHRKIRVYVESV